MLLSVNNFVSAVLQEKRIQLEEALQEKSILDRFGGPIADPAEYQRIQDLIDKRRREIKQLEQDQGQP